MSVLYVSHGHPAFAKGGGELAAWRLFEAFRNKPGFEGSGFLAAAPAPDQLPAGSEVAGLGPDEWLIKRSTSAITHDTVVNLSDGGQLHQALAGRSFQIIHLHHYLHVGIDLVLALKRWFPQAKLLLTLHDYWGPCVYEGRLLRASGELCSGGDPEACDQCLGGGRRGELAIRARRLQRMFAEIDHFLSPSLFLKQRYMDWRLGPHRISVVENLPAAGEAHAVKREPEVKRELVLGFFGQVNPSKGVDRIVEAVMLARKTCPQVRLEIHGCGEDDLQPDRSPHPQFAARLKRLVGQLGPEGVRLLGRYQPEQLQERMGGVDALVMGSIWYENAPMVIQEAFLYGRPVLVPRLGGMAEKVHEGRSGLLFAPGDAADLARLLQRCCDEPELLSQLQKNVQSMPLKGDKVLEQHQRIYAHFRDRCMSAKSGQSSNLDESLMEDLRCHFEPLGANCELGFLMGRLGIQRSSLFRWLFTPLAGLELVLKEGLQNFFSQPVAVTDLVMASDMVVDQRTGIFFHAGELRQQLEQAFGDQEAYEKLKDSYVFLDQKGKYLYLIEKFLASVSHASTLHVFSDFHNELTEAAMLRVSNSLRAMGKPQGSTVLFVKAWEGIEPVNSIRSLGDGIQLASIRRFAPGEHADRIDLEAWLEILVKSRNFEFV